MKKVNTEYFGSESLSSLAPEIGELLPDTIKNKKPRPSFKSQIKTWTVDRCPCQVC